MLTTTATSLSHTRCFDLSAGEDLWHVYNLVREGDTVTATTFRKVQRESGAGQESEKVKLKLSISVDSIDFDPEGELLMT